MSEVRGGEVRSMSGAGGQKLRSISGVRVKSRWAARVGMIRVTRSAALRAACRLKPAFQAVCDILSA